MAIFILQLYASVHFVAIAESMPRILVYYLQLDFLFKIVHIFGSFYSTQISLQAHFIFFASYSQLLFTIVEEWNLGDFVS